MTDPTQAPRFETKDARGVGVSAQVKDADDVVVEHQHDERDDERTQR